jgi:dolichol-phosphate mannosyltransferase
VSHPDTRHTTPDPYPLSPTAFWLLLISFTLIWFGVLEYRHLIPSDEGRYAEISREMVVSGDWVVPTLHNQPYLDKPPLMYWLVGGALKLFGTQVWVARLIPALATFLTIFVTFAFGRRIIGTRAAFLGAFALALMGGVVFCGRALLLDSVLTLFVVLALFTGYEAGRGPRLSWNWWLASGFFCALGILVKGPIAFILVAPPVFACGCLDRRRARPGLRHWAAYLAILTAMVAPWFVAVLFRCPQFAYYFLVEHHLFRFFGSDFHSNPVWYYIPVLFFGCMPWSLLLVPMAGFLFERRAEARSLRTEGMGYLLLWALWCLFFFSLSRGKLPPYILPAIPALALLVGKILEIVLFKNDLAFLLSKARRKIPRQSALFLAIGWIVFLVWCWFRGEFDSARYLWGFVEVLLCLAALTAILCFRRNSRLLWVLTCILMAGFILEASNGFLPTWSAKRSPVARMHEVDMFLKDKNAGVVCLRQDWGSIPFYLDNRQDFFHAEKSSPPEVHAYLRRHGHNLLISDYQWDEQKVYPFIPPDLEIMKVFLSGKARFYVIGPNTRQVRCP